MSTPDQARLNTPSSPLRLNTPTSPKCRLTSPTSPHARYVRQPSSKLSTPEVELDGPVFPGDLSPGDAALLYTRQWPVPAPRAHVYILHGYGEHCERYDKFCEILNEASVSVATHDHIGHGQSEGNRVHVDHFDTYVHDALELMRQHKKEIGSGDTPFILFGHSMGGLLATLCMLEEPSLFTAGILSSPCLRVHGKYNKTPLRVLARAISWIAPKFYIPSRSLALDPADVIADEADRQSYTEDPLVWHYQSKAGGTTAMFDAISKVQSNLKNLRVNTFVQHGTDDMVCDPAGVMPFKDIPEFATLKLYEGAKHALLLDKPEIRTAVVKDCLNFIEDTISEFSITIALGADK